MKRVFLLAASGILFFTWGCARDERRASTETGREPVATERREEKAYVRVVNAVPGGSPVDVSAGETDTFNGVSPKMATEYREFPDKRMTFRVRPAGMATGEPLAEDSSGLSGGKYYTFVVMTDDKNKTRTKMLEDVTDSPDAGKAKIRLVNAASGVGDINVYVASNKDALVKGVDFKDSTFYKTADPTSGDLEIRDDHNRIVGRVSSAKIDADHAYTIVVTGNGPKLSAVVLEDKIKGRELMPSTPSARKG